MRSKRWLKPATYSLFFASVIAAIVVCISSLWMSNVFFSPNTLSDITVSAISEQSSRDSIGQAVVERALQDRPVIKQVLGPKLADFVSSILATDIASRTLETAVERLRVAVTTNQDDVVSLDISGIKDIVLQAQSILGNNEESQRIDAEAIPNEIILIESNSLSDVYDIGIAVLWLGPISALYAVGSLGYWIYRGRKNALQLRIVYAGLTVLAASIAAFLMGPLLEPVFVSIARDAPGQTFLANLYDGLIAPFNQLVLIVFIVGATLTSIGVLSQYRVVKATSLPKNKK